MKDYIPLIQTGLWVVAVIAVVIFLRPDLAAIRTAVRNRLEGGSSVKVGPFELGELTQQIREVRNEVTDLHQRVTKLFLLAMSDDMYRNLRKLVNGQFGTFEKNPGLERELRYLRDIGYIEVESVGRIPSRGDDLSDFVTVTNTGRMFVELRQSATEGHPDNATNDTPRPAAAESTAAPPRRI